MDPLREVEIAADRARQARALLESPLFVETFEALSQEYTDDWRSTAPNDRDARDDAYHALRALDRVRSRIESVAAGGAVTAHNHRRALSRIGR